MSLPVCENNAQEKARTLSVNNRSILIGSAAAKHWFPDFREPKDLNYLNTWDNEETKWFWTNAFQLVFDYCQGNIASPDVLYTIKLSHCFWAIDLDKTLDDIAFFQSKKLVIFDSLFDRLYKEWELLYGSKAYIEPNHSSECYKNGVRKVYCHEDVHQAIAYYTEPLYKKVRPNEYSHKISQTLFSKLDRQRQIKLCREEIFAIAIEYIQVPSNLMVEQEFAYHQAAKILLTSMPTGWFQKFVALNWLEIFTYDEWPYVDMFKVALSVNQVRKR